MRRGWVIGLNKIDCCKPMPVSRMIHFPLLSSCTATRTYVFRSTSNPDLWNFVVLFSCTNFSMYGGSWLLPSRWRPLIAPDKGDTLSLHFHLLPPRLYCYLASSTASTSPLNLPSFVPNPASCPFPCNILLPQGSKLIVKDR